MVSYQHFECIILITYLIYEINFIANPETRAAPDSRIKKATWLKIVRSLQDIKKIIMNNHIQMYCLSKLPCIPPNVLDYNVFIVTPTTGEYYGRFNTSYTSEVAFEIARQHFVKRDFMLGSHDDNFQKSELHRSFDSLPMLCRCIGFMAGPLLTFLSKRQLGVIAAILLNIGSFAIIFVNSKIVLFLCQGLLQSLGCGFFYNISFSLINDYFVKRRLLAFSLTQSVSAIAALFSPQLVKMTLKLYGFRGTLILISAVSLHTFVAVCLMQPAAWHFKRVEITVEDTELKLLSPEKNRTAELSDKEIETKNDIDKNVEKGLEIHLNKENRDRAKNIFLKAIDLSLMRSFVLSNAALGMATCGFADLTFALILPQTLYSMKWTEDDVAWAVSLFCFGDLVTRILFIIFNTWLLRFESQQIYVVGLFVAVVTRIGMLGTKNITAILTFLTIMGSSRSTIFVLIPLVVGEAVQPKQFTSAMGIFMLAFGFANLIFGTAIGAVRDLTGSYPIAICILTASFAIVIISWIAEMCNKKNKYKINLKNHVTETR